MSESDAAAPRRCYQEPNSSTARCAVHDAVPDWHSEIADWRGAAGWLCPYRAIDEPLSDAPPTEPSGNPGELILEQCARCHTIGPVDVACAGCGLGDGGAAPLPVKRYPPSVLERLREDLGADDEPGPCETAFLASPEAVDGSLTQWEADIIGELGVCYGCNRLVDEHTDGKPCDEPIGHEHDPPYMVAMLRAAESNAPMPPIEEAIEKFRAQVNAAATARGPLGDALDGAREAIVAEPDAEPRVTPEIAARLAEEGSKARAEADEKHDCRVAGLVEARNLYRDRLRAMLGTARIDGEDLIAAVEYRVRTLKDGLLDAHAACAQLTSERDDLANHNRVLTEWNDAVEVQVKELTKERDDLTLQLGAVQAQLMSLRSSLPPVVAPEIRRTETGAIDEIVARGVDVHLEVMDRDRVWIGITPPGGETLHVDVTSAIPKRRKRPVIAIGTSADPASKPVKAGRPKKASRTALIAVDSRWISPAGRIVVIEPTARPSHGGWVSYSYMDGMTAGVHTLTRSLFLKRHTPEATKPKRGAKRARRT